MTAAQRWVLLGIAAIDAGAASMLLPILPYLGKATGISLHMVALCLAVYPIAGLIGAIWLGRLADQKGIRLVLIVSSLCACFGFSLLLLKPGVVTFVIARALNGIGTFTIISIQAAVSTAVEDHALARTMARLAVAAGAGGIGGRALGSFLAGNGAELQLVEPVFAALVVSVIALVSVLVGARSIAFVDNERSAVKTDRGSFFRLAQERVAYLQENRRLTRVIALTSIFSLVSSVTVALLPAWLFDRGLVHSARGMMPVYVVPACTYIFFQLLLATRLTRWLSFRELLVFAFSLYAAGILVVVIGYSRWQLAAVLCGFVMNSLATAILVPVLQALTYEYSQKKTLMSDLGLTAAFARIFTALGVAIAGPLYFVSPDQPYWFAFVAIVIALLVSLLGPPIGKLADSGGTHES
ncbi:Tetracycline resistance protein, class B [BD1-7 clade bacterium]|uniref:Tetracycline resistance protein, class B n=1 Tax=BD1-7 clade bacterium TaxID=2029982 RepID=A0A5S9N0B9_9GAMM|nr:Tetracycline resistance protein, class B [BD1-7 clade bacterium]CAA0083023.1 Tetracycline resistance protein, class B [BD1-7 clade bacterium]